jgi:hypothetical protein
MIYFLTNFFISLPQNKLIDILPAAGMKAQKKVAHKFLIPKYSFEFIILVSKSKKDK